VKKILIPTDFSDNAANAIEYTIKFFKGRSAEIHLIHILEPNIPPPEIPGASTNLFQIMMENGRKAMQELEEYISETYSDKDYPMIKSSLEMGSIPRTIKEIAEEQEVDLIVMGSRGKNHDVFDKTLGTASTSVLDIAPCPVLLIPKNHLFKEIDNVLFTTNLDHADPYELWKAGQLFSHHGVVIRCLYVAKSEKDKDTKEIKDFAKYMVDHSPGLRTIFNIEIDKNIEEAIEDYAANYEVEMVIMHKSKKSIFQKIFGTSHTKNVVNDLNYPLMVVN
jgi:nucleotide-binding universal stress UspA family protein